MENVASTSHRLDPGAIFHGQFEVVRCLKSGGMGAVYEVVHQRTSRRRALKVMLPELLADSDSRARFAREAVVTADVTSDHIVETIDAGIDDATGMPFLVMELLKGEDLGAIIATRGALPSAEVVELLHQASLGLERTHALGIVHRDLKPENLFLTTSDIGAPRVKILDFGIAKLVEQATRAPTTRSVGTPLYMAPEQIRGDGTLGPAVDLYALGHIALTLLTGEPYWDFAARQSDSVYPLLLKIMNGAPHPARTHAARLGIALPGAADAWFARATAPEPRSRFDTALELVEALAHALGVETPTRPASGSGQRASSPVVERRSAREPHAVGLANDTAAPVATDRIRPPPRRLVLGVVGLTALVACSLWLAEKAATSPIPSRSAASATSPSTAEQSAPAITLPATPAPVASAAPALGTQVETAPVAAAAPSITSAHRLRRAPSPSAPQPTRETPAVDPSDTRQ
jgi:serine/threonine protein kinase